MIATLPQTLAKAVVPALATLAFAGSVPAVQAQDKESVTVAMRVTPSASPNVTVVPKNSAEEKTKGFKLSGEMREGIQDTVRKQLKALAKGDANMAFANLSPQTQRYFAEPQRFMNSVATDAPPMVETKSFAFLGIEQDRDGALQQVLLTDEEGRSWLAKFRVERLAGDWRVESCVVEAVPGQQA
ncbi:MAG: DUF4864 domain-containing protein [Methyloligella sp. ZOD6]